MSNATGVDSRVGQRGLGGLQSERPRLLLVNGVALPGRRTAIVRIAGRKENRFAVSGACEQISDERLSILDVPRANAGMLVHDRQPGSVLGGAATERDGDAGRFLLIDNRVGDGAALAEDDETHDAALAKRDERAGRTTRATLPLINAPHVSIAGNWPTIGSEICMAAGDI